MLECHTIEVERVTYVSALLMSTKTKIAIVRLLICKYSTKSLTQLPLTNYLI